MIFNKDNKGNKELRELTGSYYANNDFSKVKGQIDLVAAEVADLIGKPVYKKAEKLYQDSATGEDDLELIRRVQQPIAIMATLRMYQRNDLSHEDSGRKFKIDPENEKLPWEWQLDRDDERHLEDYYTAVDSLIRFLNTSDIPEWKETDTYKQAQIMLIRSGREFEDYFPIGRSERTYLLLLPFMREVQMMYTKKNYGSEWDTLLAAACTDDARYAACKATALLAVSLAMKRMQLTVIPAGVMRQYIAENGAMNSKASSVREVKQIAAWLEEDGKMWLNEMKRARDGGESEFPLLPKNDRKNKFMSL